MCYQPSMDYQSSMPHEIVFVVYILVVIMQIWVWRTTKDLQKKQTIIKMNLSNLEDRNALKVFLPWILFGAFIFMIGWTIRDDYFFDFIVGGFVVMQMAGFALSLDTHWSWKMIADGRSVKGSVEYSEAYVNKRMAAQLAAMSLFCFLLSVCIHSPYLLGATIFLAAGSAGQLRRLKKK